jgi:hypothetical protein
MCCRAVVTVLIFLFTRERSISLAASSVVMDGAARLLLENVVQKQVRNVKLLAREEARARFQGREEDQCPCLMCIEGGPRSYMKRRTIREHLRTWDRYDAYRGPTQVSVRSLTLYGFIPRFSRALDSYWISSNNSGLPFLRRVLTWTTSTMSGRNMFAANTRSAVIMTVKVQTQA